jgi:hypothetical protein
MLEAYRPGQILEGIVDALAPRRRSRGLGLPQGLRLVALRLEAGLRETPERFYPVVQFVRGLGPSQKRRFLLYLATETLNEALEDSDTPPAVVDLLHRVCSELAAPDVDESRWQDLAQAILDAAPHRHRRRHIHCHGAVTSDRRLLVLRGLVMPRGKDPFRFFPLSWTIAYAMSDYDKDHFVLIGPRPARRVRRLIPWIERELVAVIS